MQQSMLKNKIAKRTMDIMVSAFALILLLPILCLIALAIRLESVGSPIFFQERVGLGGKTFRIVKFRSMVQNAEKIGNSWTEAGDKRITRVGRFIRTTSLDELPQLWNVLIGDMSLVGPRPNLASSEPLYSAKHWQLRHSVRSGITGLAQVSGRSNLSIEQQIKFDSEYARNWTLAMDIKIILKTIVIVCKRRGVN
jgi:lipopolysaccharide/colanic/teichoic acid biosynthesis glycosyltransferase